jgi:hypothetical protein
MRFAFLMLLLAGCPNDCDVGSCGGGGPPSPDLSQCRGDLAGTPRAICGMPDASFSPQVCACVGDP